MSVANHEAQTWRLSAGTRRSQRLLVFVPLLALGGGAALAWSGHLRVAQFLWAAGTAPVLLALMISAALSLSRGAIGLDIIAALAMGSALVGGEYLAGIVVALMYAGGQALEAYAQGSAEREMTALLGRVARTAERRAGNRLESVAIEDIKPGDVLLIRAGEAVPVDGLITGTAVALLDESALTGEAIPVRHNPGSFVASGVTNAGAPFELEAAKSAAESTYSGVLRLVESARASKAPMSRLADKYALGFLFATILLAGGAWILANDWRRALAVLVVATPCPLILAVPVAIVAGMSWCARRGVMVKSAQAFEELARIKRLLLDKTGTLTFGEARLHRIHRAGNLSETEILRLAGSLAQASQHITSQAIVAAAHSREIALQAPLRVAESAGDGLSGYVGDHPVVLGRPDFVAKHVNEASLPVPEALAGSTQVAVAIGRRHAGTLVFIDALRPDAQSSIDTFRRQGIERIVLVTGDRAEIAESVARKLALDHCVSRVSPEGKLEVVRTERRGGPVMMIGDGINDAPALALADVGVALGARGAAAASEAADVITLVDRLDRIAEASGIARRTRSIALQSVIAGIVLSGIGMLAAAVGWLPPLAGALVQEAIDVAVVLNALRSLGRVPWPLTPSSMIGARSEGSSHGGAAARPAAL
jgi:heavy metal translocating P-type ATPase